MYVFSSREDIKRPTENTACSTERKNSTTVYKKQIILSYFSISYSFRLLSNKADFPRGIIYFTYGYDVVMREGK